MELFRSALDGWGLHDLGFIGNIFTWFRGRSSRTLVCGILDRACASAEWSQCFPFSEVELSFPHKSDHCPIVLHIKGSAVENFKRGFNVERQRSKMHWFREGDRNTKFFHSKASTQYKNNLVKDLRDDTEIWYEKDSDIERIVVDHFSKIFETTNPSVEERISSRIEG
ncbi:hypothetical protein ACH5RR_011852 [Cinchona calisaya]|uniref:Uncharacterized protein n=1 Tax=Cinchona calisaya TaxID=153742 RepID=A0ABD3A623_9GENT